MESGHTHKPTLALLAQLQGSITFEGPSQLQGDTADAVVHITQRTQHLTETLQGRIGDLPSALLLKMNDSTTFNGITGTVFEEGVVQPIGVQIYLGTTEGPGGPIIPDTSVMVELLELDINAGIRGRISFNGPSFLDGMPATALIDTSPEPSTGPITMQGTMNGGFTPFMIPVGSVQITFQGVEANVIVDSIAFSMPVEVHFGQNLTKGRSDEPEAKVRVILTNAIITTDDSGGQGGRP